jgi:hypothetical protein
MQLSDMPREKKISCKFSPKCIYFFYFFYFIKTCNMEMTSYAMQDQT